MSAGYVVVVSNISENPFVECPVIELSDHLSLLPVLASSRAAKNRRVDDHYRCDPMINKQWSASKKYKKLDN